MDSDMLVPAENVRHLEVMKDPRRKDGFEETQKLAEYWKSKLRVTCINTELKSKLIPRRMMDLNPGL